MHQNFSCKKQKYKYTMYAVVFGAQDVLLDVQLNDGFVFTKKSLIPDIDHLDTFLGVSGNELRVEYEEARIDKESPNVICVVKEYSIRLDPSEVKRYFDTVSNNDMVLLDNQIRIIRFSCEWPLRCKRIFFRLQSEQNVYNGTECCTSQERTVFIDELLNAEKPACPSDYDATFINRIIRDISFPLTDKELNTCHAFYDLSYHKEPSLALVLLITCLEILFLDTEQGKKEKLAKRCAVYLHSDKFHRIDLYNKILKIYKRRCDFVHDGKFADINNADIFFLRECVRLSIRRALDDGMGKRKRIEELKNVICNLDYWKA